MDIALKKTGNLYDLDFDGRDFVMSENLESSVILSLDIKALEEDAMNSAVANVDKYSAGWWGNSFEETQIGSALWTIKKNVKSAIDFAKENAKKALEWLVNDGVAASVETDARDEDGVCVIDVTVEKPDGKTEEIVFQKKWEES